jgi:hypothetical protein
MTSLCTALLAAALVTSCQDVPSPSPVPAPIATAPFVMLVETPPTISTYDGATVTPHVVRGPNPTNPSWAPDGRVVYVSNNQIWVNDQQVTNLPSQVRPILPSMARDGTIVFAAYEPDTEPDANQHIMAMKADGTGLHEIGLGMAPVVAASGKWVAYTNQINQPYHRYIWRMDIDGSGKQQLTDTSDPLWPDANYAAISPDETQIALFSGKENDRNTLTQSIFTFGYRDIAVISATGGPRHRLTSSQPVTTQAELAAAPGTQMIVADEPAWTPDGKRLIYTTMMKDPALGGTWIMDAADGTNARQFYQKQRGLTRVPLK